MEKLDNVSELIEDFLIDFIIDNAKQTYKFQPNPIYEKWRKVNIPRLELGYNESDPYGLFEVWNRIPNKSEGSLEEEMDWKVLYPAEITVNPLVADLCEPFITHLFNDTAIWIKTTYQSAGQMYPIHTDGGLSGGRYYLFLQDQMPGQFFYVDGENLKWKRGDVYSWDNSMYHCSANAGVYPKIAVGWGFQ